MARRRPWTSDLDVDRPDDLGQLLVGGVLAWLRWRCAPGKVGSVHLHQPPAPVGLADGEQCAHVVLGHDLHDRVLDNLEAVQNAGRDNRDIAGSAGPAVGPDPANAMALNITIAVDASVLKTQPCDAVIRCIYIGPQLT